MAKGESDGGSRGSAQQQGTRTPLLITLVLVAVIAAVYFSYYRNPIAYHTRRKLSLLSMLTAQIDGRADMYAGFVWTFSEKNPPKDVTLRPCVAEAAPLQAGEVRRGLEEASEGWRVRLQRDAKTCGTVPL